MLQSDLVCKAKELVRNDLVESEVDLVKRE